MSRRRLAAGLFAILGALPACDASAGEAESLAATRREWNTPAEPFRVIGNIFYVGTRELGAYAIRTSGGVVLLDGALEESVPQIETNLKHLGLRAADVKILLNSHAHFDHSGGLARLKRDTGARLVASEGDRVSLESGTYLGSESLAYLNAPPVSVDRIIADGETVQLGDTTLTAHLTPGHTRGCTTWTMPVVEAGMAHTVVFYCSTSVALNRLAPLPQYPGIVEDYRHSFEILSTLEADVFLANHKDFFKLWEKRARQTPGTPNPFIDKAELGAFVAASKANFEQEFVRQSGAPADPSR